MTGGTIKRKTPGTGWFSRDWRLYLMLLLPVAFYLIFCYKPMIGVIIAFQKYNMFKGMWGSKWVGLENFRFTMGMADFSYALRNTLWLNFLGLVTGFPVPIVLAIMLNEMKATGLKRVSQTLLYLPHFLSWIIIGGMVLQIFSPTTGIVNSTLLKMGVIDKSIPFLTDGPHRHQSGAVRGGEDRRRQQAAADLARHVAGHTRHHRGAAHTERGPDDEHQLRPAPDPGQPTGAQVLRRALHLRLSHGHTEFPVLPRHGHRPVPVRGRPDPDLRRQHRLKEAGRGWHLVRRRRI